MSWKCKLFGHDWEVVREHQLYIFLDILDGAPYFTKEKHGDPVKDKVCLRCGECFDARSWWEAGYTKQQDGGIRKEIEKNKRRKMAKALWGDCPRSKPLK